MDLLQLRDRVRRHLQEMGTASYPDDHIRDELNRSQRTLAKEYTLFRRPLSVTVTSYHFTPPADFNGFAGPVLLNGFELAALDPGYALRLDQNAFTVSGQSASPEGFYYGTDYDLGTPGDVYLWPSPPVAGVRLDFVYHRTPTAMASSGDLPWFGAFEDFHDLISLHAAHQLAPQTGASGGRDATWLQRLEARKDDFRGFRASEVDGPPLRLRFAGPSRRRRGAW